MITGLAETSLLPGLTGMADGDLVYVASSRDGGFWKFHSGDCSVPVTATTPYRGLWMPPDTDTTGASGAWERVVEKCTYLAEWFLPDVMPADAQARINAALASGLIPLGAKFWMPPRQTTTTAAIRVGIRSLELTGYGRECPVHGDGSAYHLIEIHSSNIKVSNLYAGNVEGNLPAGESSAFHIYDNRFPLGSASPFEDVENVKIEDCGSYLTETGCRAGPAYDEAGNAYIAREIWVSNFRAEGARRIGIEMMSVRRAQILCPNVEMMDPDIALGFDRCVRNCGSKDVLVKGGHFQGNTINSAVGISTEAAGFGSPVNTSILPGDCFYEGNNFENTACAYFVNGGVHGTFSIRGSHASARDDVTRWFLKTMTRFYTDDGTPFKMTLQNCTVAGNTATNISIFAELDGQSGLVSITDNKHITNASTQSRFCVLTGRAGEPNVRTEILRNEHIGNGLVTGGTIRAVATNAGDVFVVNGNKSTPDATGFTTIAFSGDGTLQQDHYGSNEILPPSLWAAVRPALDMEEHV